MLLSELLEGLTFNVTAGNSGNTVNPADVEIKDVVNDNRIFIPVYPGSKF